METKNTYSIGMIARDLAVIGGLVGVTGLSLYALHIQTETYSQLKEVTAKVAQTSSNSLEGKVK